MNGAIEHVDGDCSHRDGHVMDRTAGGSSCSKFHTTFFFNMSTARFDLEVVDSHLDLDLEFHITDSTFFDRSSHWPLTPRVQSPACSAAQGCQHDSNHPQTARFGTVDGREPLLHPFLAAGGDFRVLRGGCIDTQRPPHCAPQGGLKVPSVLSIRPLSMIDRGSRGV